MVRLVSHGMLLRYLETKSLWSVARGLARTEKNYKQHLQACDEPRYNDLDSRGTLSQKALKEFTSYFLSVCVDQVSFMRELMQPAKLRDRVMIWTEEEIRAGNLPAKSDKFLKTLLFQGEVKRAEVTEVLNSSDRSARRITSILVDNELIQSKHQRAPFTLKFPAKLAERWMPNLFPAK